MRRVVDDRSGSRVLRVLLSVRCIHRQLWRSSLPVVWILRVRVRHGRCYRPLLKHSFSHSAFPPLAKHIHDGPYTFTSSSRGDSLYQVFAVTIGDSLLLGRDKRDTRCRLCGK